MSRDDELNTDTRKQLNTDDELRIAEMLLPLMGHIITTEDEVLRVVSPQKLIQAIKAYTDKAVKEAVDESSPLATRKRIVKGECKNGHKGHYAKNSKGYNYCKKCQNLADARLYKIRLAKLKEDK
jgi:hypothetical protein